MAAAENNKTGLALGAALLTAAALTAAPAAEAKGRAGQGALIPEIRIDRPVVLAGDDTAVYVLVRFAVPAAPIAATDKRPPLDLALVLDRSGSMADKGKITYLKRAAKMVVDNLRPRDRLAIVEYDDRVSVMWPFAPVESPAMVKRLIDALEPRNATDLVGGMMRGADQLRGPAWHQARSHDRAHAQGEPIRRVLLLSDGLANRGVTDPREIRRLVRGAKRDGVRISALGLGLEYNEDLMQSIAENAGGAYYYIEHPNQMAGIFRRELQTLFGTVARDVRLSFQAGPAVRGIEVYGVPAATQDGETRVELDDFYSGEERSLLLRLDLGAQIPGETALGTLKLAYFDVERAARLDHVASLAVQVSLDRTAAGGAVDKEVVVEAALVEAERRHEDSLRLYEQGKHDEADKKMQALAADLKDSAGKLGDSRLASKLEAVEVEQTQMATAARAPRSSGAVSGYLKASKQRLYRAKKGNRKLYQLRAGDNGHEVERLQRALAAAGAYSGAIDGRFTEQVATAVEIYQRQKGLAVDGIAGPATMQQLGLY